MEIFVYDKNFMRQGTIENHTSLQWHRKYYDCGTFELHCPITEENLSLLVPGNIITIGDKKEAAVIRGDQTEEESTLVNEIIRTGYFLTIFLNDRITGALFNFSGTVEDAMRELIGRAAPIQSLQVAGGIGDQTETTFQVTYKNLLASMSKLARYAEIGFRIIPDLKAKAMTFETYKGEDKRRSQRVNQKVIFAEQYDNLNHAKHTYSDANWVSKVIVGGAGEGEARTYVTVGGGTGNELREYMLDAKEVSKDGLTEDEYKAALEARGGEFLAEHGVIENFEAEVNPGINFIYKEDYDLGDIVTVQKEKWGISHDLRITEILEVYEYGEMYIVPTMGEALPTAINWEE